MSRFHDEFLWLEKTCQINKHLIKVITSLNDSRALLTPKVVKIKDVVKLTKAIYNGRSPYVSFSENLVIKYVSLRIGNKIYFTDQENSMSAMEVNMAYDIVEQNVDYDLCKILK